MLHGDWFLLTGRSALGLRGSHEPILVTPGPWTEKYNESDIRYFGSHRVDSWAYSFSDFSVSRHFLRCPILRHICDSPVWRKSLLRGEGPFQILSASASLIAPCHRMNPEPCPRPMPARRGASD